jgi:hypothetical protein
MGKNYVGKNRGKSLKALYYKRRNYKDAIYDLQNYTPYPDVPAGTRNLLDYQRGELVLFGKVNAFSIPVIPRAKMMKSFSNGRAADPKISIQAMDFVVDQFEDMANQFQKLGMTGRLDTKDKHLAELKIFRAYESPRSHYKTYSQNLASVIRDHIYGNQISILNFDDFMAVLMDVTKNIALEFPFTLPGYVKSKLYSCTNSGLVLEIADVGTNDDEAKVMDFFNSLNWELWTNQCNNYGFVVDGNMPWRIMADLNSVAMKQAALRYGSSGALGVLSTKFASAPHVYVFRLFGQQLLNLYNKVRKPKTSIAEVGADNSIRSVMKESATYTLESLNERYSAAYFMSKYFEMRFAEEETFFTDAEQRKIVRECIEVFNGGDRYKALLYFETILNKPFDYRGSTGYTIRAEQARAEARGLDQRETEEAARDIERELLRVQDGTSTTRG